MFCEENVLLACTIKQIWKMLKSLILIIIIDKVILNRNIFKVGPKYPCLFHFN